MTDNMCTTCHLVSLAVATLLPTIVANRSAFASGSTIAGSCSRGAVGRSSASFGLDSRTSLPLDFLICVIWYFIVFSLHLLAFILLFVTVYFLFTAFLYSKCTHNRIVSINLFLVDNQP